MYSLLVAAAAALITFVAIAVPLKVGYAIVPALLALGATYFFVARRHARRIEGLVQRSMHELQQQRVGAAVELLRQGYPHARWVFLMRAQLDGQIGMLKYLDRKFDEAVPLLEKAWSKHWVAKGMLAADHFRHHRSAPALATLDAAIAANKKEPLLYGLKAWMQVRLKDEPGARATLAAGDAATSGNPAIKENLLRLANGKELQMRDFGDVWWQFHLEKPTQKELMRMAGVTTNPTASRRAAFRN